MRFAGFDTTVTSERPGTISLSSSRRFPANSGPRIESPRAQCVETPSQSQGTRRLRDGQTTKVHLACVLREDWFFSEMSEQDRREKLAPYPSRSFAHPLELTSFVVDGKAVANDRRGKAALSAKRQAFQRHKGD